MSLLLQQAYIHSSGKSHQQQLLQGVEPSASKEAVKQAYRLRALKYHPDVTGSDDPDDRARFVQISEAYEVRACSLCQLHPTASLPDITPCELLSLTACYTMQVLRDDSKRRAYDAVRAQSMENPFVKPAGGWQGSEGFASAGKDFDAEFEKWWRARGWGPRLAPCMNYIDSTCSQHCK